MLGRPTVPPPSPAYVQLLASSQQPVTLVRHGINFDVGAEDDDGVARSDTSRDVAVWLHGVGLEEYIPVFQEHRIVIEQLRKLDDARLAEIGVRAVGDRLRLLDAIQARPSKEDVRWTATEARSYHGACDYFYKVKVRPCVKRMTCQPKSFYDQYTLTSDRLIVMQRERGVLDDLGCIAPCGRVVRQTTRHIELEQVTAVTASTTGMVQAACDFGVADVITVELDKMKMLRPLQPLFVEKGAAADVVDKIMQRVLVARSRAVLPCGMARA